MFRILGIGDNTVDIYYDQGIQFPGGNAINVAVLSTKLGAEAGYLGCISTDLFGNIIKNALINEGVEISHSRFVDEPNSWSRIRHIDGDRSFDGSYENEKIKYELTEADFSYISSFDLVHSSVYSFLESELENIKKVAKILSFDFSDCYDENYIKQVAGHIDVAFISDAHSDDEACRKIAKKIASFGPELVIVTRGEKGVLAFNEGKFYSQGIIETDVVDTLGAGDGFIAAFLNGWLVDKHIPSSLLKGVSFAAKVCTYRGGFGYETKIQDNQPGLL